MVQPFSPQAEDAIYDSESVPRFARVELVDQVVPEDCTMLRFGHLLEQHGLAWAIFTSFAGLLEERRLLLRSGTIAQIAAWAREGRRSQVSRGVGNSLPGQPAPYLSAAFERALPRSIGRARRPGRAANVPFGQSCKFGLC
jgi:IS5 family transposase